MSTAPRSDNRSIARAASVVMPALVVSQVISLLAKMLVASTFGTGAESEAFFAANRFSEILFNLVAGGALASAFIPMFTGLLAQGKTSSAWRLASAVANLVTLILLALAGLAFVFAPQVVQLIVPGFFADPIKFNLTVELLRLQLPSAILFGLSGLVMGILNAHQVFLFPALAPAMYPLGWIFGLLLLAPTMGVHGLAWGVVIGAGLHLLIQIPALLRLPAHAYQPTLGLGNANVREVMVMMGPRLLGVAVVQLNFLLNFLLASSQPEGSLTGITLGFTLMLMPQAAIAQSVAIAALPTFSAQAARNRLDEMRTSLSASLRGVLLLAIPASVGLILLRRPLVALIFERRSFTAASVELVAWALLWYAAGLVGHSLVEVVSRAFYALHDTKTPVMLLAAAMSLNLLFSLLFSELFRQVGWAPHGGLALANSLATFLEMCGLLFLMRRRLGGLDGQRLWRGAGLAALGAVGMGLAVAGWMALTASAPQWLLVLGGVALGGMVYGVILLVLGVDEVGSVLRLVRRVWLRLTHKDGES